MFLESDRMVSVYESFRCSPNEYSRSADCTDFHGVVSKEDCKEYCMANAVPDTCKNETATDAVFYRTYPRPIVFFFL